MVSKSASLGAVIRQIRSKRGLTQAAAAEMAGVSSSYWALIEQGKRTPNLNVLEQLARALNVPSTILVFLSSDFNSMERVDQSVAERLALLSWKLIEGESGTGREEG